MERQRVDGNKMQNELAGAIEKSSQPAFAIRLHTPQAQQANVRNIADFIIYGRRSLILEVKETAATRPYRVAVLVHFMRPSKYVLYYLEDQEFIVMHPEDKTCLTWETLKEAIDYIVTN